MKQKLRSNENGDKIMNQGKIKSIKALAKTKFLSLYDLEYINKKGNIRHWTVSSRKTEEALCGKIFEGKEEKIDAVVIVAFHKDLNKLVLVRQYRVPINDYIYELPAGLIDGDEDVFTAVRRELKEETGLKLVSIDDSKSMIPVYPSGGMSDESMALIYCLCEGEPSDEYLEEDEDIEVVLVSEEEGSKLLNSKVKFDAKAYMALQNFIISGKDIVKNNTKV